MHEIDVRAGASRGPLLLQNLRRKMGLVLLPLPILLLVDLLQVEIVHSDEARVRGDGRLVHEDWWHQSLRVPRVRLDGLLPIREHDGRLDHLLGYSNTRFASDLSLVRSTAQNKEHV